MLIPKSYVFLAIFALTLPLALCQTTATPTWAYETKFKCGSLLYNPGTVTVVSTNTAGTINTNVNYPAAYTGSAPHVSLGVVGLTPTSATASGLYFLANIGTQNVNMFTIQLYLNGGSNFSSVRLSYFSKDATLSYIFVGYQAISRTCCSTQPARSIRVLAIVSNTPILPSRAEPPST